MIIKKNKNQKNVASSNIENELKEKESNIEDMSPDVVFDISEIDFNTRIERRQGDRRRGYRRIDDRSLVSRAQQEAITIKENAKAQGYQEGIANAEKDIQQLNNTIKDFMKLKDEVFNIVTPKILEISMEIAKKIIKKEVETSQDIVKGIIIEALNKLTKNEKQITLRVSPIDRDYVKLNIENILEQLQIESKITIQQDIKLTKGSVVIETNNGLIDASIDTGIQIIEQLFKNMQGE